ncbi:MAG: class I SAM-dependent methyltransferase [Hyphomonadaceae bacterium]|nr:class I SAM-dependent methyltransferase [Hyphomonadaceae bacterium]
MSILVRLFGFPATLIHGDPLVWDRWRWLKRRLPVTANGESLIDVGCGSGAFSIGAAKRGYRALGLSWDIANQEKARERARQCRTREAQFEICDVRELDERQQFREAFDVAICCENIEHILNDAKLMRDMAACLKPGGRLLLTTPNYHYRAITKDDNGPFATTETGEHVRRGYTRTMLLELIELAGLKCEEVSYCSGYFSQKVAQIMRALYRVHPAIGWTAILPLRPLVPLLDATLGRMLNWPGFSICIEAYKPRYAPRVVAESGTITALRA